MAGLILVVIAVAVFFWYRKKKQGNTSTQNNVSATSNISVQSNSFAPFKNEAEKQYYEMAYGLLSSSLKERNLDDIRRFVEFHTSRVEVFDFKNLIRPSDAAKKFLKEDMYYCSLFNSDEELTKTLTAKGVSADQIEQIIKLNKSLDESLAYRYLPKDANKICDPENYKYDGFGSSQTVTCKISKDSIILFKDQPESVRNNILMKITQRNTSNQVNTVRQDIEKDCKEVFDRCSSCEPKDLIEEFHKSLELRKKDCENIIDEDMYVWSDAWRDAENLFCEVLYDNYFDNIKCVLVDAFNKILSDKRALHCKVHGTEYMMVAAKQAAAITLRALNYEKHGQNKESYSVITEDICQEFISNHEIFKSEDENEVIDDVMEELSNDLCGGGRWYLPYELKDYHMDAVCNEFWKNMTSKHQEGDSTDSNYVFNMLLDYFKPSQAELDHIALERRQYLEIEARKKAVRKQCDGCARKDYCQERDKRENCSAWIPKQR